MSTTSSFQKILSPESSLLSLLGRSSFISLKCFGFAVSNGVVKQLPPASSAPGLKFKYHILIWFSALADI